MTQTKKLRAVTFNKAPIFGDKAKVFVRDDDKWLSYSWEEMLKMTVKDVMDYKMRFIVQFIYEEEGLSKKIRVCSHKEDVMKVALKFPKDFTINLMSVLRIFKHDLEEKHGEEVGKILFCASELGAEIVRT